MNTKNNIIFYSILRMPIIVAVNVGIKYAFKFISPTKCSMFLEYRIANGSYKVSL